MAIIIGRRDDGALISTAGPIAVPQKTPTQEFAQGVSAMTTAYSLGKTAVKDAADLALLGGKAVGKGIDAAKRVNWQNAYDQEYGRVRDEARMYPSSQNYDPSVMETPAKAAPATGVQQPEGFVGMSPSSPGPDPSAKPGGPAQAVTPGGPAAKKLPQVQQIKQPAPTPNQAPGLNKKLQEIADEAIIDPQAPSKMVAGQPEPRPQPTQEEEWDARARRYADMEVGPVAVMGMGDYVDRMRHAVASGDNTAMQKVLDDYDKYGTGGTSATTAWEWLTGSADRKERGKLEKMATVTPLQAARIRSAGQLDALRKEKTISEHHANANAEYDRVIKIARELEKLKGTNLDNKKKRQELQVAAKRAQLTLNNLASLVTNRDRATAIRTQLANIQALLAPWRADLMRAKTGYFDQNRTQLRYQRSVRNSLKDDEAALEAWKTKIKEDIKNGSIRLQKDGSVEVWWKGKQVTAINMKTFSEEESPRLKELKEKEFKYNKLHHRVKNKRKTISSFSESTSININSPNRKRGSLD